LWTFSSVVVPAHKDVSDAMLGEKSLGEANQGHSEVHTRLLRQGYKVSSRGLYTNDDGEKVRIHGATKQVYKVKEECGTDHENMKEELDPVRDVASRKGIVGKLKGLARDAAKKYKAHQAAGDAAAKKARKDMGLQENPRSHEYKSMVRGLGAPVAHQVMGVKSNYKSAKYINPGVGKKKKFSSVVHDPAPNLPEEQKLLLGGKKKKKFINHDQFLQVYKDADKRVKDAKKSK